MESILIKIIESVVKREKDNFDNFIITNRNKKITRTPIDIINKMQESFFYIFEIKKASPSKGVIRKNFDLINILTAYENSGASAISIITEPCYFKGEKEYLTEVRKNTELPILRKDFIIHPFQIYESYNLGADFILLIARCLDKYSLRDFYQLCLSLGMNALIEVHNEQDIELAMSISPKIIGINNRDLSTFKVNIRNSIKLKKIIPNDIFVISESGITCYDDLMLLKDTGFSGVLIGEALLRNDDIYSTARSLIYGKS